MKSVPYVSFWFAGTEINSGSELPPTPPHHSVAQRGQQLAHSQERRLPLCLSGLYTGVAGSPESPAPKSALLSELNLPGLCCQGVTRSAFSRGELDSRAPDPGLQRNRVLDLGRMGSQHATRTWGEILVIGSGSK